MEIFSSPSFRQLLCSASEFQLLDFIQQGGSGKVYSGYWNQKKKKVALKFFGYSISEPNEDDIFNEIRILQQLQHIHGFVQVEAVFFDPSAGKAENKIHLSAYPCIVMELLEGKELIEVIDQHHQLSELDLATIFRQLIQTLYQCHEIGFIHRDLKLQNLMFADKDSLTSCKIIDCGMMVQLPKGDTVYTSQKIQGTMGYVAPESLTRRQYSAASDLWQAGVCLYSLLSGSYPFNPRYPEHVVDRGYVPMVGLGWKNISDNAKDLVSKLLIKNPVDRITLPQIFLHPWLQINGATKDALGPAYAARLKQLLLRQKLKEFFVESDLEQTIAAQRENLLEVAPILRKFARQRKPSATTNQSSPLPSRRRKSNSKILPVDLDLPTPTPPSPPMSTPSPSKPPLPRPSQNSPQPSQSPSKVQTSTRFLRPSTANTATTTSTTNNSPLPTMRSRSGGGNHSSSSGASGSASGSGSGSNSYEKMKEFNLKLNQLKSFVVGWVQKVKSSFQLSNTNPSSSFSLSSSTSFNSLDYESFERILLECGLDEIAKPEVFSIFDLEKCGEIKLRDFLLTLQAFKPLQDIYDDEGRLDSARFYFRLFDLNETGSIDLEDLKIVVSCLVLNDLPMLPTSGQWTAGDSTPPSSPPSPSQQTDHSSSLETSDSITARSVSDLFSLINISSDGRIDFDEFRLFYDAILAYTNTRQSLVSYETEATRKVDQVIFEDQFRCFGFDF